MVERVKSNVGNCSQFYLPTVSFRPLDLLCLEPLKSFAFCLTTPYDLTTNLLRSKLFQIIPPLISPNPAPSQLAPNTLLRPLHQIRPPLLLTYFQPTSHPFPPYLVFESTLKRYVSFPLPPHSSFSFSDHSNPYPSPSFRQI